MITFSWQLQSLGPATGSTDARDLALGNDGDLLVVDGDLVIDTGVEAIASDLRSRLQTFAAEYFLDTSLGVPWLQPSEQFPAILGGKPNVALITEILRGVILETPGVVSLAKLLVQVTDRTCTVSFRAMADTGQVIVAALALAAGGN